MTAEGGYRVLDHVSTVAESDPQVRSSPSVWVRAPYGPSPLQQLAEFWRRRELMGFLVSYGLGRLYSKTFLGKAWLFIRPAIMVGGAVFVVGKMLGVSTAPVPLVLFSLASFAPWLLFQRGLLMGARSFSVFKVLFANFLFPRIMAQMASIAPSFLIFLLVFAATLVAMAFFAITGAYAISLGLHMLWAPVAVIMTMMLVWGLCFFAAPLNAMAADTVYTLRYVLTVLMIASPVFYPLAQLDENVRAYMWYNPIACILELYRWGLFHRDEPSWWHIWLGLGMILALFVAGWWFFSRCEQKALDEI
jgi:ABC-type polysaccharide/polyol phosphate export permease